MLKVISQVLVVASGLFFLESAFEMYILTPLQGPQMLFFSVAHIAPLLLLPILFVSGLAFICLMVFAAALQVGRFKSWLGVAQGYRRVMLIILCVQAIHIILLLAYDHWAFALFAGRS